MDELKYDVSFIIPVLDSHEIIRRLLLWYTKFIPSTWEMIIVDDGSPKPIVPSCSHGINLRIIYTKDGRPWTQGCARNMGALYAKGKYLLMTDVDHFFTKECFDFASEFKGDLLFFDRTYGVINEDSQLVLDQEEFIRYGLPQKVNPKVKLGYHCSSYLMKKSIFYDLLGGYDKKFCGRYGKEDSDLIIRYRDLVSKGLVEKHSKCPHTSYVFPNPNGDKLQLFHHLRWPKGIKYGWK